MDGLEAAGVWAFRQRQNLNPDCWSLPPVPWSPVFAASMRNSPGFQVCSELRCRPGATTGWGSRVARGQQHPAPSSKPGSSTGSPGEQGQQHPPAPSPPAVYLLLFSCGFAGFVLFFKTETSTFWTNFIKNWFPAERRCNQNGNALSLQAALHFGANNHIFPFRMWPSILRKQVTMVIAVCLLHPELGWHQVLS